MGYGGAGGSDEEDTYAEPPSPPMKDGARGGASVDVLHLQRLRDFSPSHPRK